MEFSVNGFIKRYCTPNALLTFVEYLEDYASEEIRNAGLELAKNELSRMKESGDEKTAEETECRLERIRRGERDLLF